MVGQTYWPAAALSNAMSCDLRYDFCAMSRKGKGRDRLRWMIEMHGDGLFEGLNGRNGKTRL